MSGSPAPLRITGLGVQSALGSDPDQIVTALVDGKQAMVRPPDGMDADRCTLKTRPMELDRVALLGEKGVQFLNRASVMAIAAVRSALQQSGLASDPNHHERVGIVLGTAMGSFRSISEFTREALTADPPHMVSPMMFPSIVLNAATAQAAIWLQLRGPNSTVSEGHMSGLMAMRYAAMAIRRGYVDAIAVGAVEELCPQTAWARYRGVEPVDDGYHLGEGAACIMLESEASLLSPGRPRIGRWVHSAVATVNEAPHGPALSECIARCLREAGASSDQVTVVVPQGGVTASSGPLERKAIDAVLGSSSNRELLEVSKSLGDLYGAAGSMQVLCALVRLQTKGGLALVTSSSRDSVGCALIAS